MPCCALHAVRTTTGGLPGAAKMQKLAPVGMCQPALVGLLISTFIPMDPNVSINMAPESGRWLCINLCPQLLPKVGVQERSPLQPPAPEVLQNTVIHILAICHNPQCPSPGGELEGCNAGREFCLIYSLYNPFQGLRHITWGHIQHAPMAPEEDYHCESLQM